MRSRISLAIIVVAALTAPAVISGPTAVADGRRNQPSPPVTPDLSWTPCFEEQTDETGAVFECADAEVPLDYDRPDGRSITVALVRLPATDPANRMGSILLNPGGPGGSGIDFAVGFGPFVGQVLGAEIPARFDLVGFDPRGISRSTPIRCFDTFEESVSIFADTAFPLTRAEEWDVRRGNFKLALSCLLRRDARQIGAHMSTANVARDMDLIREGLGDEEMNFLGLSYGTYVGATYANLFPDRVRSVVVDGVLDPLAWVNEEAEVPFSTRLRSDEGAQETLEEFFTQCEEAASGNCAVAPNSSDRYAALADSLLARPLSVVDPETGEEFTFKYQDLIGLSLSFLYGPFGYADLANILTEIETGIAESTVSSRSLGEFHRRQEQEQYENVAEGFPAVACVDTNNPRSYRAWRDAGAAADKEFGYFGRLWTWASSPCARWPFRDRDRYEGPFTAETANPVLVIGNLYDPATRYEGAQALRSLLPNSALLTVDVPAHTSLGASVCAGFLTGQYLLDPSAAASIDGTTCPQEFNVFDAVAPPPAEPETTTTAETSRTAAPDAAELIDARQAIMDVLVPVGSR